MTSISHDPVLGATLQAMREDGFAPVCNTREGHAVEITSVDVRKATVDLEISFEHLPRHLEVRLAGVVPSDPDAFVAAAERATGFSRKLNSISGVQVETVF